MPKGRPPRFTQAEIDEIKARYYQVDRPLNLTQLARLYRCSVTTIIKAVEGKLAARA